VFGDGPWRYHKPLDRPAEDRTHLADFVPAKAPRFHWRREAVPDHPRVTLQCSGGEIEFELAGPQEKVGHLLAQIHMGYYSGGRAVVLPDRFELKPAEKTPDQTPIPKEDGKWDIGLGDPSPETITAKVIRGASVLSSAAAEYTGIHVQRMVRLN
jgi:hypothetical protein